MAWKFWKSFYRFITTITNRFCKFWISLRAALFVLLSFQLVDLAAPDNTAPNTDLDEQLRARTALDLFIRVIIDLSITCRTWCCYSAAQRQHTSGWLTGRPTSTGSSRHCSGAWKSKSPAARKGINSTIPRPMSIFSFIRSPAMLNAERSRNSDRCSRSGYYWFRLMFDAGRVYGEARDKFQLRYS